MKLIMKNSNFVLQVSDAIRQMLDISENMPQAYALVCSIRPM